MKKIYIHIGTEKTGTTAIQDFLHDNSKLLAEKHKIFIPIWEGDVSQNTHKRISKAFVPDKSMTPQYKIISIESFESILNNFVKSQHFNKLIISSELFSYSTAKEIMELKSTLQNFDVTIIVFLRRQDEYIESIYDQHVKKIWMFGRPPINPIALCKSKTLNYFNFLLQWYENGFKNIDLKIYGLSKAKDFIFHQFFENIDNTILDNEEVIINEANPALSLFHTILINEHLPQIENGLLRRNIADLIFRHNKFYAGIANSPNSIPKAYFTKEFKTDLLNKYEHSNNEILKLFPNTGFSKNSLFKPVKDFSEPLTLNDISKKQIMKIFFNFLLYIVKDLNKEKSVGDLYWPPN